MLRRIFGRNIKYYRFQNNMTQEKLAELTDLSPRYTSNIENGGGNVSLDTIELLAEALEVDYTDLFTTTNKEIKIKKSKYEKRRSRAISSSAFLLGKLIKNIYSDTSSC